MGPEGPTIRVAFNDFLKNELDNFLHKNPNTAEALLPKNFYNQKKKEKSWLVLEK